MYKLYATQRENKRKTEKKNYQPPCRAKREEAARAKSKHRLAELTLCVDGGGGGPLPRG